MLNDFHIDPSWKVDLSVDLSVDWLVLASTANCVHGEKKKRRKSIIRDNYG